MLLYVVKVVGVLVGTGVEWIHWVTCCSSSGRSRMPRSILLIQLDGTCRAPPICCWVMPRERCNSRSLAPRSAAAPGPAVAGRDEGPVDIARDVAFDAAQDLVKFNPDYSPRPGRVVENVLVEDVDVAGYSGQVPCWVHGLPQTITAGSASRCARTCQAFTDQA